MTALPDIYAQPTAAQALPILAKRDLGALLAARFLGCVGLLVALGVWAFPVTPGDVMMQVIKLAVSGGFFVGAMVCLTMDFDIPGPEIQIDPARRELLVIERDAKELIRKRTVYALDDLGQVELRGEWFVACDREGRELIRCEIRGTEELIALNHALSAD